MADSAPGVKRTRAGTGELGSMMVIINLKKKKSID